MCYMLVFCMFQAAECIIDFFFFKAEAEFGDFAWFGGWEVGIKGKSIFGALEFCLDVLLMSF